MMRPTIVAGVTLTVLAAGACSSDTSSDTCFENGTSFEGEARLYIEHNATDQDTGFHGMFEQEGLSEGCIVTPDGREVMFVNPAGKLDTLGINQFFFESREPPNDEYSVADLKGDFPEGEYRISGLDHEGEKRVGSAKFSHAIPAQPTIVEPTVVGEEDAESNLVGPTDVTVRWEAVTETIDGEPVTIRGYEVIVTQDQHDDPHGLSRPVYDVHVPPDMTELPVPEAFLRSDTLYELEVLALEESGNQTITVGFFTTRS